MATYPVKTIIEGEPTFEKPVQVIFSELQLGGAIKILSPAKYITEGQRAWWKGILLPALALHTGDSVLYWETKLKLAVMPDEFQPIYVPLKRQVFPIIPSITILSVKKMGQLMDGSVKHLREDGGYGEEFQWVTLPDSELSRKKKNINKGD